MSKSKWTMLKALVKVRVAESFSGFGKRSGRGSRNRRRGMGGILIYAVLMVFVMISMGTMFLGIAGTLMGTGMMELFMPIALILAFFLCFVGSVYLAQHQLFEAKDNDAMFSMPIPPRMLLISRILSLLLINYYYELMIGLPAGVIYGLVQGFSAPGLINFVLGMILMPFFALTLSILLGYIIALISSRMRNSRIVSLVLSVGALAAYMWFIMGFQERLEELAGSGVEVIEAMKRSLPPVWHFGNAVYNGSFLSMLIFALFCLLPFAAACAIIAKNFIKIATTEKGARKIEYRGGAMKTGSRFSFLVGVELRRLGSSNMYMMNSAIGLVFLLLLAGAALFKRGEFQEALGEMTGMGIEGVIGPMVVIIFLFMAAMVYISSATVSLDAYTMWIVRSLPASGREILLAKAMPHIIVSVPFFLAASILMQFALPMDAMWRAGVIVIPILATVHNSLLGVVVNLKWPKLDWLNETAAVKRGLAPMLTMLLAMIPPLIVLVAFFALVMELGLPSVVILVGTAALFILLSILYYALLGSWGVKRYAGLQA